MNPLMLGLQSLRIAQFLQTLSPPTSDDRARLNRGLEFLRRMRGVYSFVEGGEVEHLEESSFAEARYAARTISALRSARSLPPVAKYLRKLEAEFAEFVEKGTLSQESREELRDFFGSIGQALVEDAIESRPVLDVAENWSPAARNCDTSDSLSLGPS